MSEAPTRLLLVRHGETHWNVERRFQGQQDSPLTERGRWQVERLAARLRPLQLAAVYSSDLQRTMETARPLADGHALPVQPVEALREANFGQYEGATFAELVERFGDAVIQWANDPVEAAPPDGETLRALHERVAAFMHEVVARHRGQTVLLVGHGGSVRAAVMEAIGLDRRRFRSLRMDNASLSVLEGNGVHDTLILFNDTAHLSE
jgi:alpha-ribazole phosphatase